MGTGPSPSRTVGAAWKLHRRWAGANHRRTYHAEQSNAATARRTPGTAARYRDGLAGRRALQDVLPEVHALAQKCGGLDKLAEIVENLRTSKPV